MPQRHLVAAAAALGLLSSFLAAQPSVAVTVHDPTRSFAGYTTELTGSSGGNTFRVFAMNGVVAHTWTFPLSGWGFVQVAKPISGGGILALVGELQGSRKLLVELDWSGAVRWAFDPSPLGVDVHHDFQRLDNGNTLLLASVGRIVRSFRSAPVLDDLLIEIDPAGRVVWLWSTLDNAWRLPLSDAEWSYLKQLPAAAIFHTNSLQSLPDNRWAPDDFRFRPGNLLVSQRETSMIFVVDRATGEVLWSYRGGVGQHHARMIPQDLHGEGNILFFDNGGSAGVPPVTRPWSRIVELHPLTQREVWSYHCSPGGELQCTGGAPAAFFSPYMGSAQRLPNGNTLITESTGGRVFEVTSVGELVWEYVTGGRTVYRAYRWPFRWRGAEISPFFW